MPTDYDFFSDDQIETAIGQFMRALSGFRVQSGVRNAGVIPTKKVPVIFGDMERIVAEIMSQREDLRQKPTIPLMAVNLESVSFATDRKVSRNHIDEYIRDPNPTDPDNEFEYTRRVLGPPLNLELTVNMLCASRTELYQLFEQIALVFNPRVTINVEDTLLENPMYITDIFFTGVSKESTYPMGQENRTNSLALSFTVPIRLHYPNKMASNIIEVIKEKLFDQNFSGPVMDEFHVGGSVFRDTENGEPRLTQDDLYRILEKDNI